MINLDIIKQYYRNDLAEGNVTFHKNILKEHIELMVLEYLSTTPYYKKLTFIGGTNLRLLKGINRFSEDLDFDIKDLTYEEFIKMTDGIARFLMSNGLRVEIKEKESSRLNAFRRSLYFPGLLYDLGLTGHKEERFLLKIEAQDQTVSYKPEFKDIRRNGFFFPIQTPSDNVLLSMKLSALLNRAKGRDFYDIMFLLGLGARPDYDFLKKRAQIEDEKALKEEIDKVLSETNLKIKKNDFSHLIFDPKDASRIERFQEYLLSFNFY